VLAVPATFPSHAAAVLPLKLWRPNRFDGVALVAGSAAPDMYYALNGFVAVPPTHNLAGLFWFGLPVALVATWLSRWAAPTVAAHLPSKPALLALPDYGVLGLVRHPWYVTVSSALFGAGSHIVWDGFTHSPEGPNGWGTTLVPGLTTELRPGLPWWFVAQHVSTVLGALAALAIAIYLGRRRLLRAWHGPPPPVSRTHCVFWSAAVAVAVAYPLTWPLFPYRWAPYVQGVRMLWAVALAMLAGAAAATLWRRFVVGRGRATEPGLSGGR
jgi:hypothetical protein